MRIIKESDATKLPVERPQRLFIELWYGMVHRNSLDSHRVRCMNSVNILQELFDLTSKDLPKINDEIIRVTREALQIVDADKVITTHYSDDWLFLRHLIESLSKKDAQKDKKLVIYFLRDFLHELNTS